MIYYLKELIGILERHPEYLQWFLVLILLVLIGWLCFRIYRRKRKADSAEDAETVEPEPQAQETPSQRDVLARSALALHARIRASFSQALKLLHSYFPERRYRYRLPWFLLMGEARSGKSTMMRCSGLKLPLGLPDSHILGGPTPCKWWFFDQAVVLDLDGASMTPGDSAKDQDKVWTRFTKILYGSRPERALDGVILTLPVTELLNFSPATRAGLEQQAAQLYQRLRLLQKNTGISFPVYLVVTQCDKMEGFSDFCSELPARQLDQIFGWATPYELAHAYNASWLDDAFRDMLDRIGRLQLEVAYKGFQQEARDGFFLFPNHLAELREPLTIYCDELFTQTAFHDPLFFRGVYFTGAVASKPESEARDWDEAAPAVRRPNLQETRPYFVKELLQAGVFPEHHIARPTRHKLKTQNKSLAMMRIFTMAAALIMILGATLAFRRVSTQQAELFPALKGVEQALAQQDVRKFDTAWISRPDNQLFTVMGHLEKNDFFSIFIPSSWGSDLRGVIGDAATVGYERIMLDSLSEQLRKKADLLTASSVPRTAPLNENSSVSANYEDLASYTAFQNYIHDLGELEKHIHMYDHLKEAMDLEHIRELVKYCFNFDMPRTTLARLGAFEIDFNRFGSVNYESHNQAGEKAKQLYQRFLDDLYNPARVLLEDQEKLRGLLANQANWIGQRDQTLLTLREISLRLKNTERFRRDEPLGLFEDRYLDLGEGLSQLLEDLEALSIVNPGLDEFFRTAFRERFFEFKDQLDKPFIDEVIAFREPIRAFFSLPFLKNDPSGQDILIRENYEIWEKMDLFLAMKYHRYYKSYHQQHLANKPQGIWTTLLEQLSVSCLEQEVNRLLSQGPILPMGEENPFSEAELRTTINGFFDAYESLSQIEDILQELGLAQSLSVLTQTITETAVQLLIRADLLLDRDLYEDLDFSHWDGQTPISPKGFGLEDARAMEVYLNKTRLRLWRLAGDYVAPLIDILEKNLENPEISGMALRLRWKDILKEIHAYDAKKPYPAVRQLEVFFTQEVNRINLQSYQQLTAHIPPSSNYFLEKINRVKRALHDHCDHILTQRRLNAYDGLRRNFTRQVIDEFNADLARHFPFADPNQPESLAPVELERFLGTYRNAAPPLKEALEYEDTLNVQTERILGFMQEVESSAAFLEPFLKPEPDEEGRIEFRVLMRANREAEVLGNQIIEWSLRVGDRAFSLNKEPVAGVWRLNDPVTLTLRWARNAPTRPAARDHDPWYETDGVTAEFNYGDAWSFFRFIARHQEPRDPTTGRPSNLLRFEIPLESQPNLVSGDLPTVAVVYLSISQSNANMGIALPDLPRNAPDFDAQTQPDTTANASGKNGETR